MEICFPGSNLATYFSSAENLKKGHVGRNSSATWIGGKVRKSSPVRVSQIHIVCPSEESSKGSLARSGWSSGGRVIGSGDQVTRYVSLGE